MAVNEFFDSEAAAWTERYRTDPRFTRRFDRITETIAKHLPKQEFTALDAGCGSGVFSRWLAEHEAAVTAIDPSHLMIEQARRQSRPEIKYIESDIITADLAKKFDVTISLSMLEYVADASKVLDILSEHTTSLLVISVPNRNGLVRRLERAAIRLRRWSGALFKRRGAYLTFQRLQWQPHELDDALRRRGFERTDCVFVGTAVDLPNLILPLFERRWWAAMYCGVYRRTS